MRLFIRQTSSKGPWNGVTNRELQQARMVQDCSMEVTIAASCTGYRAVRKHVQYSTESTPPFSP